MSDPALLDQLVPPRWTGRRRATATLGVVAALVGLLVLWWSGLLGPNLAPVSGYSWGPTQRIDDLDGTGGTVEVELELDNRGLVAVVVDDLEAGFLTGAQVTLDAPVTVPARGRAGLRFDLVVASCAQLDAPSEPMLTVAGRSGPLPFAGRRLPIRPTGAQPATWGEAPGEGFASWWYLLAQTVCDPEAARAP